LGELHVRGGGIVHRGEERQLSGRPRCRRLPCEQSSQSSERSPTASEEVPPSHSLCAIHAAPPGSPRWGMLHSGTAVINLALGLLLLAVGGAATTVSAACSASDIPADAPAALVFSGGGAKGAWEAGVAASLIERGVPVRAVAGSSSGALNAVMVADGRIDRLEALWRSLTRERVYSLRPSVFFAGLLPGWLTALTLSHTPADRPRPSRRLREVFEDAFETLMVHQIRRDAELGRLRHRVDVQVIEPSAPLLLRPLDFESGDLSEALARGRADGVRCLD